MRTLLLAALAALLATPLSAAEPVVAADAPSLVDASTDTPGVEISAIPAPLPIIEKLEPLSATAKLANAKKHKLSKKRQAPIMLLTRTERQQVALLVKRDPHDPHPFNYDPRNDFLAGLEELDLHRSYSRPKLAEVEDVAAHDADDLDDSIKLRLWLARMKAVEAHWLNQAQDDGTPLPDRVQSRLAEARAQALAAHTQRWGA